MLRVIRQDQLIPSDEVVVIPDTPLPVCVIPDDESAYHVRVIPLEDSNDEPPSVCVIPDDADRPPVCIIPDDAPPAGDNVQLVQEEHFPAEPVGMQAKRIQHAEDVAQKILQNAGAEREKLLEQARAEAAGIRERAYREGYEQALTEKRTEVESALAGMEETLERLTGDQKDFLERYARGLRELALDIAEKVMRQDPKQFEAAMAGLVIQAVSALKNEQWISVEISDRLPKLADILGRAAAEARDGVRIDVETANAPEDHCVLRTATGEIDASVSVQLSNLRDMFEKMD